MSVESVELRRGDCVRGRVEGGADAVRASMVRVRQGMGTPVASETQPTTRSCERHDGDSRTSVGSSTDNA